MELMMGLELQHECSSRQAGREQETHTGGPGLLPLPWSRFGLRAKGPLRALNRERADCNLGALLPK